MPQRPDLSRLAASTDGVLTSTQLVGLGLTESAIRHRVRTGELRHPHSRVYVATAAVADETRTCARAALAAAPGQALASHLLAGHLHRFPDLPLLGDAEVTIPAELGPRRIKGVVVHRTSEVLRPIDQRGLAVTSVHRTLRDLAPVCSDPQLLSALDAALRRGLLSPCDLSRLADPQRHGRGTARLRRLAPLATRLAESPLESRIRLILHEGGLPAPDLQLEVVIDGVRYRIDMGYRGPLVGIEGDGREFHSAPQALLDDRVRQNALVNAGWQLLRFTWRDATARESYILDTVRAALTGRRFR